MNSIAPKIYLFCLFIIAAVGYTYFFHLPEMISLRGFSVLEFLEHKSAPENFLRDFPGGSNATALSILTSAYYPIHLVTGLSGITLLTGMIWLEILSVIGGAWILWHALLEKSSELQNDKLNSWFFTFLAAFLVLSSVTGPDLAGFGFPFFHGQFYGFADALRFVALAYAIKGNWRMVALTMCFGFMVHPIKIATVGVFIFAGLLCDAKRSFTKQSILCGFVTAIFCLAWSYFWLDIGRVTDKTAISSEEFIAYTRLFQYHWYPFDLGTVTDVYYQTLSPFIALVALALLSLRQIDLSNILKQQIIIGYVVLTLLTLMGLYFSVQMTSQEMIKLCLIRASDFMTILAPFFIVFASIKKWQENAWHWIALYMIFLIGGFETTEYLDIGLVVIAYGMYFFEQKKASQKFQPIDILLLGTMAAMIIAMALLWHFYPGDFNPLQATWKRFIIVIAVYAVLMAIGFIRKKPETLNKIRLALFCIAIFICSCVWTAGRFSLKEDAQLKGSSFYDVQMWARNNTDKQALFMVDPCISYGWRDFSARSSLGTPREWYMTGWIYITDGRVLEKGKAIGQALGLDMKKYLRDRTENNSNQLHDICSDAQDLFYQADRKNIIKLIQQFDVNYFVMVNDNLDKIKQTLHAEPVFKNTYYSVYDAKDLL